LLTRCPRCKRALTLTPASLRAARGLCQCGHCRALFVGWAHLLAEPAAVAAPIAVTDAAPVTPAPVMPALQEAATDAEETRLWAPSLPEDENGTTPAAEMAVEPAPAHTEAASTPATDRADDALPARGQSLDTLDIAVAPRAQGGGARRAAPPPAAADDTGPEPLRDPPWYREPRAAGGSALPWLWGLALVVLVLGLLAQLVWMQAGALGAGWPATRPALVAACTWLGCEVPWLRDLDHLRVRQSDVREHPALPDSLLVTITLVNEAHFEQPYPLVELTLGDGEGQPSGRRQFRPEEYLGPAIERPAFMPVAEPVQVSLELAGRHDLATAYTIELH
jgi:hypothetical protein